MQKQQLQNLVNQDLSTYQIAKELNKSQTTIRYWLNKYKLKTNFGQAQKVQNTTEGQMKKCPKCLEIKELFGNFYVRKDGRFHVWCRKCLNKNSIDKQRENKLKAIKYKGGKCICCGYNYYYGALEFHHLDPSKKDFSPSTKNYSFEKLQPEIDKCVLVCSNCHKEIHAGLKNL